MNQQLSFDFTKEKKANIEIKHYDNDSAYSFENLFMSTNDITEMHSKNSMAILGDSLNILKKIKTDSIKLIFADAPYNIGKDFGNNHDKWKTNGKQLKHMSIGAKNG